MKKTSWIGLGLLIIFVAFMVHLSLQTGGVRCEVCIEFHGHTVCRAVDGPTQADALNGAITNACALLSAGVTDVLACERTPPTKTECR